MLLRFDGITQDRHLNNYFRLRICLSFCMWVRNTSVPAVVSLNVNNKSCLTCVKTEKYAFWDTHRPLGSMRPCLHTLRF